MKRPESISRPPAGRPKPLRDGALAYKAAKELRILILEDVETDADLMRFELDNAGIAFSSRRVDTREAFLRQLDEFSPDLILADYSLPSFDGMSALSISRKKRPEVPFIFVSGAMGEERAIEFLKEGATDYILKDRLSKLPSAVLRALRERQERTERMGMERKLRDSEEKYRSLVESTDDSIYMVDRDGVYLFANEKYLSRIGLSASKVIDHRYGEFHLPAQEEDFSAKIRQVFETGLSLQYEDSDPNGNRYFLRTLSPTRNPETNKPVAVTIISKDITERRYAEDVLRKAHDELAIANRKLESEIAKRDRTEAMLQEYHKRLRSLTSELTLAEERERKRIATELHERLGQILAITKLKIGVLGEATADMSHCTSPLQEISGLIDEAIEDTRSLTREISSPVLHQFGFIAAIEWLIEHTQEKFGIPIEFENEKGTKSPEYDFQILLYQSTRELLMNSVKHAHAGSIKVHLGMEGDMIRIEVRDNGVGFRPISEEGLHGFGLFSIRERLRHLGGELIIKSQPGEGTSVTMVAPRFKTKERRRATDKLLM